MQALTITTRHDQVIAIWPELEAHARIIHATPECLAELARVQEIMGNAAGIDGKHADVGIEHLLQLGRLGTGIRPIAKLFFTRFFLARPESTQQHPRPVALRPCEEKFHLPGAKRFSGSCDGVDQQQPAHARIGERDVPAAISGRADSADDVSVGAESVVKSIEQRADDG